MNAGPLLGNWFEELSNALRKTILNQNDRIDSAVNLVRDCLLAGGKILICGNGGSAADSQHIAAEFVNRFRLNRSPLAALALTTDSSILTACGNDFGFEYVFEKQVQALGDKGDILWAISTSGNSPNVIRAIDAARQRQMNIIGFTGKSGGEMARLCDVIIQVESDDTPRIQEVHIFLAHAICDLIESAFF